MSVHTAPPCTCPDCHPGPLVRVPPYMPPPPPELPAPRKTPLIVAALRRIRRRVRR